MSFRGVPKSDTSGFLDNSFIVEARPVASGDVNTSLTSAYSTVEVQRKPPKKQHYNGSGLHSFLAGKDPTDCLGELADEIDMTATTTIGKGHFGEVKQARRRRDALNVAVKIIPLREVGPSVRREVQAMHDLDKHPNLIRLVDVYACRQPLSNEGHYDGPYICIVTEFVENAEPLARRIAAGGPQPQLASNVMPQLADALALVHARGYVHRDVWSENVLVKSSGHVVLVDFGASVRFDQGEVVTDRLNIPYAAPESSHRARQGVGEDCWAVGLLLSEIVTGQFLCDRIGTSTIPAYTKNRVMNEVKNETAKIGGRVLGKLTTDLLHFDPGSRTAMKDVRSYFNTATSLQLSPKSTTSLRNKEPSHQTTSTTPPGYGGTTTTPPPASWAPNLSNSGRIPTPCQSDRGGSFRHNSPDNCADLSPMKTPVKSGNGKMFGDMTFREFLSNNSTTRADVQFEAGTRVTYTARSNGMQYTGAVQARSLDGKGWQLNLDCGEAKTVPDSDAWRISRI
jgi:serine/threonine protein kinase